MASMKWACPWCSAAHHFLPKLGKCHRCDKITRRSEWGPAYARVQHVPHIKQITTLVAMITSMRSCISKADRKQILFSNMKKHGFIRFLVRVTYDPEIQLGFTKYDLGKKRKKGELSTLRNILRHRLAGRMSRKEATARWAYMIEQLGEPFAGILNGILDKNLRFGLRMQGINKVRRRLRLKPFKEKR